MASWTTASKVQGNWKAYHAFTAHSRPTCNGPGCATLTCQPKQGTRRCMRPTVQQGATIHPLHILLSQASSCSIISARYIRRRFCNTSRITSCDAWGVGYEHTKVRRTNKLWMMCIVEYVSPRWRNRTSSRHPSKVQEDACALVVQRFTPFTSYCPTLNCYSKQVPAL
jgi:hypothetical protein